MRFPKLTSERIAILVGMLVFACAGLLLLFFAGVWVVENHSYRTKAEAVQARFFERGWLPLFIPESAANLSVANNTDVNTSVGSFEFDPKDAAAFTRAIRAADDGKTRHGSEKRMQTLSDAGYERLECSGKEFCWVFFIHPDRGLCEYWGVRTYYRGAKR